MMNGKDSRVFCGEKNEIYQKGGGNDGDAEPELIEADVPACDGVIHVLNNVMRTYKYRAKDTDEGVINSRDLTLTSVLDSAATALSSSLFFLSAAAAVGTMLHIHI